MSAVSKNNALKDNVTIGRLLIVQLIALMAVSLLLYLKSPSWPVPGLFGGLIIWLPNVLFALFTQHNLEKAPISSAISWSFTMAWITKIIVTIILSIVAIQVFKTEFIPLSLGFLSVIIMQFLAPVIISIIRN